MRDLKTRGHVLVNTEECKGCGLCIEACPTQVLYLTQGFNTHGYHPSGYKGEGCSGCGICFYACPEPGAITVYKRWDQMDAEQREAAYREFQKVLALHAH